MKKLGKEFGQYMRKAAYRIIMDELGKSDLSQRETFQCILDNIDDFSYCPLVEQSKWVTTPTGQGYVWARVLGEIPYKGDYEDLKEGVELYTESAVQQFLGRTITDVLERVLDGDVSNVDLITGEWV